MLDAAAIADVRIRLSAALNGPSGLGDAARVDALRALEELICTATAAQAFVAAELSASVRADQAEAGVPAADRGKGVAAIVAFARRESHQRGHQHLGLAMITPVELPHTWAAWRAGRITEWTATVIARETATLPLTHRRAVDDVLASDPGHLEALGQRELVGMLRAEAERLDPAAVVARRRRAESERRVTLRPAPDTMSYLTALLPVKDGVAVLAALTRAAATARAGGDTRSQGQVMADELVVRSSAAAPTGSQQSAAGVPAQSVELCLVMSDHALFGGADDAARLEGFGPIPAELAREIVAGALSAEERVGIRRLYTSPATGALVAMESASRVFRGNLAKLIRLRDQFCRTPWCNARIRHIDHPHDAAQGGPTSGHNGQGLCESCNHAKTAHRWRARPGAEGAVTTELPSGHTWTTSPPPTARVFHRNVPRLIVDYYVAG